MLVRLMIALFIIESLVACQSLAPRQRLAACGELDWYELGRSDGVRGQTHTQWRTRAKQCEGFGEELHRTYLNGWYLGVNEFCSPMHGYTYGRSGHAYFSVCPESSEAGFLEAYQKGIEVFLLENSNKVINGEIRAIETRIAQLTPREKMALSQRLEKLLATRAKNNGNIAKLEAEVEALTP